MSGTTWTQKVWKFSNETIFFLIINFQTFWVLLGPSATYAKSVLLENRPLVAKIMLIFFSFDVQLATGGFIELSGGSSS